MSKASQRIRRRAPHLDLQAGLTLLQVTDIADDFIRRGVIAGPVRQGADALKYFAHRTFITKAPPGFRRDGLTDQPDPLRQGLLIHPVGALVDGANGPGHTARGQRFPLISDLKPDIHVVAFQAGRAAQTGRNGLGQVGALIGLVKADSRENKYLFRPPGIGANLYFRELGTEIDAFEKSQQGGSPAFIR